MEKTLFFLHGLDSSGRGFKAQWFTRHFPDMHIHDYAGDLAARMRQLEEECRGLSRLVLVGSSFGGLMATCYCRRYPGQCEQLILLAPALNFAEYEPPAAKLDTPVKIIIGARDTVTPPGTVLPLVRQTFLNPEISLVEDDHMLHETFPKLDWQALLF